MQLPHMKTKVSVIYFLLIFLCHLAIAQDNSCDPRNSPFQAMASDFASKAVVVDPKNNIGFWKTDSPINVCWEDFGDFIKYENERKAVRIAIKNTWEKHSQLSFSGWAKCKKTGEPGIHIAVKSKQPVTKCLGVALDSKKDGMSLNFDFKDNWGKAVKNQFVSANGGNFDKIKLLQMIAVHEFGHAIGLAHLQDRPDCHFCKQFDEFSNTDRQKNIGIWFMGCEKNYSIMNYCLNDYINNGELSKYDQQVIGILYGPKNKLVSNGKYTLKYIVNDTGMEVDADDESLEDFEKLKLKQKLIASVSPGQSQREESKPQKTLSQIAEQQSHDIQVQRQQVPPGIKATWSHVILTLTASRKDLDEVEYVKYYLYENMVDNQYNILTFPSDHFLVSFFCWGQFEIQAEIKLKGNQIPIHQSIVPNVKPFSYYNNGKYQRGKSKGESPR